ncbi:hypothetical protein ACWC5C_20990 [Streptomyces sp. NPDC001700]
MGLRLLYLIFCRLLGCLLLLGLSAAANDAEILALRQRSLCCVDRSSGRGFQGLTLPCSPLSPGTCHLPYVAIGWSPPGTLLTWHRRLVRWRWHQMAVGPGRPPLAEEAIALIQRLAREKPDLGICQDPG